jgi:septal ring factor EnvC (AmiA/AmiB activator)
MGRGQDEATPDRRADAAETPRRFRMRIRDWLVAVVLVALVAAGVAQVIRGRRLQVERELAEALRRQEEAIRELDALRKSNQELAAKLEGLEERLRPLEASPIEASPKPPDGVFPDPDRKGRPNDGRTDL